MTAKLAGVVCSVQSTEDAGMLHPGNRIIIGAAVQ